MGKAGKCADAVADRISESVDNTHSNRGSDNKLRHYNRRPDCFWTMVMASSNPDWLTMLWFLFESHVACELSHGVSPTSTERETEPMTNEQ